MKLIPLIGLLFLIGCGSTQQNKDFETWYQNVINEPYDPMNGSKY